LAHADQKRKRKDTTRIFFLVAAEFRLLLQFHRVVT
jgi:hypothetical protein